MTITTSGAGVELVQARGKDGQFEFKGVPMRLGAYNSDEGWYLGVHSSTGGLFSRLSLEYAKTLKEASDMLRFGFFLRTEADPELIAHLRGLELLSVPAHEEDGSLA